MTTWPHQIWSGHSWDKFEIAIRQLSYWWPLESISDGPLETRRNVPIEIRNRSDATDSAFNLNNIVMLWWFLSFWNSVISLWFVDQFQESILTQMPYLSKKRYQINLFYTCVGTILCYYILYLNRNKRIWPIREDRDKKSLAPKNYQRLHDWERNDILFLQLWINLNLPSLMIRHHLKW